MFSPDDLASESALVSKVLDSYSDPDCAQECALRALLIYRKHKGVDSPAFRGELRCGMYYAKQDWLRARPIVGCRGGAALPAQYAAHREELLDNILTDAELAERIGVSPARVGCYRARLRAYRNYQALDAPEAAEVPCEDAPYDDAADAVQGALAYLTPRQADGLQRCLVENQLALDIARSWGVSGEQVRQDRIAALKKLRQIPALKELR